MSNTETLPRPGEVVIRHGEPYVLCGSCKGTGEAQLEGDPFCTECFGARVAPVLDAARFRFNQVTTPAQHVAEHLHGNATPSFSSGPTQGVKMCSEKQLNFILSLARQTGITHTEGGKLIADLKAEGGTPGFTSRRAGEVIDFLKAQPKIAENEVSRVRRNRMEQKCDLCGQMVPADAGILTNNGRWIVTHDGPCPREMSEEDREINRLVVKHDLVDPAIDISTLVDGRYADYTNLDSSLKLRITRNDEETIVYVHDAAFYGHGQEYGTQLPGETYRGKVAEALRSIVANPIASAARYGQLTNSCGICGRTLEDTTNKGPDGLTSLERGIGPICFQKLGGSF